MTAALGPALSGLGGYLAVVNFIKTVQKSENSASRLLGLSELASASMTLVGASIEIGGNLTALGLQLNGRPLSATSVRHFSTRLGVNIFIVGGTALSAIIDSIRAFKSLNNYNPEQATMYLGSALAGGFTAVATWAGGSAAAASLIAGVAVPVLGMTTGAWAAVALLALGVSIYFSAGVDNLTHGPVEIWLKHSAWGTHHDSYTASQELEAVQSLYHRPRIASEWQLNSSSQVGTLWIKYQTPSQTDNSRESFQTRLAFKKDNQSLRRINGPVILNMDKASFNPDEECIVTPIYHEGAMQGWMIVMHKTTKVLLEYLYTPDLENPENSLAQPDAPEPLVFSAAGLFTQAIDASKLNIVNGPAK